MTSYFKKTKLLALFIFIFISAFQLNAQDESWETYLKRVDNYLMEVTVNMDLHFERPYYKNLLIAATKTRNCHKNGFPTASGLEEFYTFSDSIAFKIQKHTKNKLAGIVTYKCIGFDIYYVKDTTNLRKGINEILDKNFAKKRNYLTIRPDKKWTYFNQTLLPKDLSNEFFINHEYLTALAQTGDPLDSAEKINHWFYFNNIKRRSKFMDKVKILNFAVDSVTYRKDKRYPYQAVLSRTDSVHPESISIVTKVLKQLSQRYYGIYEGWEIEAIAKEEN